MSLRGRCFPSLNLYVAVMRFRSCAPTKMTHLSTGPRRGNASHRSLRFPRRDPTDHVEQPPATNYQDLTIATPIDQKMRVMIATGIAAKYSFIRNPTSDQNGTSK